MVISQEVLRRALVIPTDRPLEACLAALPSPLEGLREKPFPDIPTTTTTTTTYIPAYLSDFAATAGAERKGRPSSPAKRLKSPKRGGPGKGRVEKGPALKGASGVRKPAAGAVARRMLKKSGGRVR